MKIKNIAVIVAAGLCACVASSAQAEVLQTFTFSLTTITQGATTDNTTNSTIAAPKVKTHNTAELLNTLAKDTHAAGTWTNDTFPAGAKIASGNGGIGVYLGTNLLVDVSGIMSVTQGPNTIISGKEVDGTGLGLPTVKRISVGTLTFDDTGITGGTLRFTLTGLVTSSKTDSKVMNGVYTEMKTGKLTNGVGEGSSNGVEFVCTGSITASGSGKLAVLN